MPPLGHAPISSCLHGTWRYEYLHANVRHSPVLQPQVHYVQLIILFYVLSLYARLPLTKAHVDQFPSMHHQADLLLATFAHVIYHQLTSLLALLMALADNHGLGSLELLHGYYGTEYDLYHDDPITHELHAYAVQVDHQYDDPISLPVQLNALLLKLHPTSILLQF